MESHGPAGLLQWWERGLAVPCRDATPEPGSGCYEETLTRTECETVVEGGEPVRKCMKLYRRYIKCAGSPVKEEEQRQEVVARGEGAQQLEPLLGELPSRRAGGGAAAAPASGIEAASAAAARMEDMGHAVEEFLRFAEQLQEQMVPGALHLDQAPPAPSRPFEDEEEQQQYAAAASGQQQYSAAVGPGMGWLNGLLFGRRRGEAAAEAGGRHRPNPTPWKDFERDFTEV